ncbi:uncharacterized protein LOC116258140 [Nymphaea colorata]|nr:uncharacterized protein LOC116258140 [Nymphaea colorata]
MGAAEEGGESSLRRSRSLLASLRERTAVIRPFRAKWASVNRILDQLPSQLDDLADFPRSGENPLCAQLLRSLADALAETLSLACACDGDSTGSGVGKLRMQSDIDAAAMKLGRLLRDCELLLGSGVLREEQDTGEHPARSRREALRHDARTLIARLQIGDPAARVAALDSLLALVGDEDKNVLVAVAQGAVPVLARLLDSATGSSELREGAVSAIARISQVEGCRHALVVEGVLGNLIRIVESAGGVARERACVALETLTAASPENARAVGTRPGVAALVEICQIGTPSAQALAAGVLRNVAGVRRGLAEDDDRLVPALVTLVNSGTLAARENAAECLVNLAMDDEAVRLDVVREGGVQFLRSFWDGASTARSQEIAVRILRSFADHIPLAASGFGPRLADALNSSAASVRAEAAETIAQWASPAGPSDDYSAAKVFGEANCVAPLVRMLEGKVLKEREAAVKALAALVGFAPNRRILKKEEKGVTGVVQILDPSIKDLDKKWAIAVLTSLSKSGKCRKQMVDAGAIVYLQKLAAAEVTGARKLLECLNRGKLWNVFVRT